MRFSGFPVLLTMGLVAAGCSGADDERVGPIDDGATEYTVLVDAAYPAEAGLAFTQYFPEEISVHPGDRVLFENHGLVNPHTVSFGADADGSNLPRPLQADGSDNPAANEPCFSQEAPTYDMTTCPSTIASLLSLPAFDGTGYWSAGVQDGPVTVQLDPSIPVGTYPFFCAIHPGMGGTMKVAAAGEAIPKPAEVAADGELQQQNAVDGGEADAPPPQPSGSGKDPVVIAGWATPALNVNRFEPAALEIEAGETVTWTVEADYIHTVTSAQLIDGEVIDSGYISPLDGGTPTFSITFPDAGVFEYICSFHSTMTGTVTVT